MKHKVIRKMVGHDPEVMEIAPDLEAARRIQLMLKTKHSGQKDVSIITERYPVKDEIYDWVMQQDAGSRFKAISLWEMTGHSIARESISRILRELANDGLIRRSRTMRGKNSEWIVCDPKDKRDALREYAIHNGLT
jgi:hypothetical protein